MVSRLFYIKDFKMKRLTLLFLLCAATIASRAHDFEVDGIYYYYIQSSTEVTVGVTYKGSYSGAYSNEYSGQVTIPETVSYNGQTYRVTAIGAAFYDCKNLSSITIPNSVTSIGENAFNNCDGLTSITIPNSVTSIGTYAFEDCDGLTSIEIPNSVISIGNEAFYGCSSLTSITIPNSVTSIGSDAFDGTPWHKNQPDGLVYAGNVLYTYKGSMPESTSITIREGTIGIANSALSNCKNLTTVTMPESLTSIGNEAFKGCTGLGAVTIPENVTSIGSNAFADCSNLYFIDIPQSVTTIGVNAFNNTAWYNNQPDGVIYIGKVLYKYKGTMPENTSIKIPEGTISIAASAFDDNYNNIGEGKLTSITIPKSLTHIGISAFHSTSGNIKGDISVHITSMEAWCNIEFENDYSNPFSSYKATYLYLNGALVSKLTIPNTISNIKQYAFYNCSSLTSVNIPQNVSSIGERAFSDCSNLTSINIPEGVISVDLSGCSSLTSINIPDGVTSVDLSGCSSLNAVSIPDGVISIGLSGCNSLTSVNIPNSITNIENGAFRGCSSLTSINIPNNVTEIGEYAFSDCNSLTSITLGNGVTSIGYTAFEGCNKLNSIIVKEENSIFDSRDGCNAIITSSNNELFLGCSSTTIPESVTSIGSNAFHSCSGLSSIIIPKNITSIGYDAFHGCTGLTSIVVEEDNPFYDSRDNCNAIISTSRNELIAGCSSTIIPASITSIGDYAFNGCSSLTSITIPESITSIGNNAFYGCTGLERLVIPRNVTDIGYSAFYDCLLQSIYLYCKNLDSYENYSLNSKSTIYAYKTEIPLIQKRNQCNYATLDEPYTIKDCKSYIHGVDFNLAGNSLFENNVELLSIEVGGQNIAINDSNKYEVYGLDENTQYDIKVTCKVNDSIYNITEEITTKNISVASYIAEKTNKTMSIYVRANQDKTCSADEMGFLFNGKEYKYSGDNVLISNLTPNESYTISPYAYYGAKKVVGADKTVSTYGLEPKMSTLKLTPTTYQAYGHYKIIDACISETGFTNHTEGDILTLTGLDPSTKYTIEYYVKTKEGSNEKVTTTFTTPALEMTTLNPKVVSNSCAIVAATTNMSDEETNAGFQWRKYEAPETLPSSEGYAAIYDGQLEGYIKNLQSTSYYNVRAFYKSTAGNYYYSDWMTFDPSDFSYFEPTVHTYPTEELTANSAKVKGYVMQGTDDIAEQGFMYWPVGASRANATRSIAIPENASMVIAKGQVMNATLEGLTPNTTYNFCAFVTTASGTTYGEEQSFTTEADETGIEYMESGNNVSEIVGYYDLNGCKLSEPQNGITIVRYSDGTTRKVLMK